MDKDTLMANLIIQYFEVDSALAWDFVTDYRIKESQLKKEDTNEKK